MLFMLKKMFLALKRTMLLIFAVTFMQMTEQAAGIQVTHPEPVSNWDQVRKPFYPDDKIYDFIQF